MNLLLRYFVRGLVITVPIALTLFIIYKAFVTVDGWIALSTLHVERARASGALAPLSIALNGRGMVATQYGEFETATSLAAEKDVINEVTGICLAATCDLLLAGYRGRPVEAVDGSVQRRSREPAAPPCSR